MSESQFDISLSLDKFGLGLLSKSIRETPEEDLLISPLSLSFNLALCALGADGETADQIKSVLSLEKLSADEMNEYFKTLASGLGTVDSLSTFTSANSIWADYSFPLKPSFVSDATSFYQAKAQNVDFSSDDSWAAINSWCDEMTAGQVREMPKMTGTSLALINALHFKGEWGHVFDKDNEVGVFHTSTGDVPCEFMTSEAEFGYRRLNTCRLLSLPYGKGGFEMLVIYPFDGVSFDDTLAELESEIGRYSLVTAYANLHKIKVKMPLFRIENTKSDFVETLKSMGLELPFSDKADFSRMTDQNTKIDAIVQKSCIDVNETGTEAASISATYSYIYNPGGDYVKDDEFFVDSPFMFMLMECGSGTILYAG